MGNKLAIGLVASTLGAALALASCAEGTADDPLLGAAATDAATGTDAPNAKIPPKGSKDGGGTAAGDDDDTTPDGAAPNDDAGTDSGPGTGLSAACAAAIAKASWDFEASDQGWTHKPSDGAEQQATWPFDPWSRGPASTIPCPAGSCWAGERTQNYAQCSRGELLSPVIDLSACTGAKVSLVFAHAYAFWTDTVSGTAWFDGGIVELSNNGGTSWSVPSAAYPGTVKILKSQGGPSCVSAPFHTDGKPGFTGTNATASEFTIAVPASMLTTKTRIRFSTGAGVSTPANGEHREGTEAGWRVDNVRFVATP